MELFVVKHVSGKVVAHGLASKGLAKTERKKLHTEAGIEESSLSGSDWNKMAIYHVSPGQRHRKHKG